MATGNKTDDVFLLSLLQRIVKTENLPEDVTIDIKAESQGGNGFIGLYRSVVIQNKNKVMKLFVKSACKSENVRRQMHTDLLFRREIYFYESVYPSISRFQRDRNLKNPFDGVCRCHLTSSENLNETLIFENLKEQGYGQYNKKEEMNDLTIILVFKQYARFHAISYAMKDQEPELYAKLSENLQGFIWPVFKSAGVDMLFIHYCEKAKELFDSIKDAYISNRIKNLTEILMDNLARSDEIVDHSVIAHGDCWFNNFLFKYKDGQNTFEDMKILDWQLMRMSSPVLDLSYFFYGIATQATLDQLDLFLKTYHDTLSETIMEMGSDPKKLYPYEVFREHWKQYSKFGFLNALSIQKLLLTEKFEIPNPIEVVDAGGKWAEAFISDVDKNELYEQRIREITEHFVHNDFI